MSDELLETPGNDLLREIVDFVVPLLPPYEISLYLLLIRLTFLNGGGSTVRIGKRSISKKMGKGTRSSGGNFEHITEKLQKLEHEGFISVGSSDRLGTEITVRLPSEVPAVKELIALSNVSGEVSTDHFNSPELRKLIFLRDGERCHYCGEPLTKTTASLDHVVPVSRGGGNSADNLVAACMVCNAIKSGRTYEEAAPEILARLVASKSKNPN
jgi:hypothetical protein